MSPRELKRHLGFWPLVVVGVAYMTPMTVFDTFGLITEITEGRVAGAYLITTLAVLLTAASYMQMAKAYPGAGSAYLFAQKTVGPKLGFLVGWAALFDYLLMPMINVLLPRIYLGPVFPAVPDWVWVVSFATIITGLNLIGVKMSVRVTAFLVALQFLVCVAVVGLSMQMIPIDHYSFAPLWPASFETALAGAAILVYSFLGFDAVTTLAEDVKRPTVDIPRAVLATAIAGGLLFATVSYFVQLQFPTASLFTNLERASPQIALTLGGPSFQIVFSCAAAFGVIASGMASQMSTSRLLFGMGRDGLLPPSFFAYLSPSTHSPSYNIALIGAVSLVAAIMPLSLAISMISFGALVAFSFVNYSCICHYILIKKQRRARDILRYGLIPGLGLASVAILWANLDSFALVSGLVWLAIGAVYATLLYVFKGVDPFRALAQRPDEFAPVKAAEP